MEIMLGGDSYVLNHALLVYQANTGYGRPPKTWASKHQIAIVNGRPQIQVGQCLTKEALGAAVNSLAHSAGMGGLQWTDDSVVATGPTVCVWWTPAQKRYMYFASAGMERGGEASIPPLVWINTRNELYVYALKENIKPGPATPLYDAPLYNVFQNGKVCQGSMKTHALGDHAGWTKSFFLSAFTGANPFNRRLTKHKGTNQSLWTKLLDKPDTPFPVAKLKEFGATLEQAILASQAN